MIKINDVVKELIYNSETAWEALRNGYLNLTAYAKSIHKEVENRTKKPVSLGAIVVSLARIGKQIDKRNLLTPQILVNDITVKTPLIEITYDKSTKTIDILKKLQRELEIDTNDFLTITQGVGEITIVVSERLKEKTYEFYKDVKPEFVLNDLASLTVKFPKIYINQPNAMYAIMKTLAVKRINIIEIVSTYTELSFILKNKDLQDAFNTLNKLYR